MVGAGELQLRRPARQEAQLRPRRDSRSDHIELGRILIYRGVQRVEGI